MRDERWMYVLAACASLSIAAATLRAAEAARAADAGQQHPQGQAGQGQAGQSHAGQSHADHMKHRFDDPARYAKQFDDPARDAWQMPDRVIEALRLAAGASVADIGAGTGYFSVRLAKTLSAGTVYAVDVEPSMLDHLRTRAAGERLTNVVAVQARADSPNLPKPVDAVLVVDTFHHIPNRVSYFRNLKTSLTPAATVTIIDFRKDSPEGPPPQFRFEADEIVGEMKEAGFTLDVRHEFLPRQHFLIFRAAS